MDRTRVLALVAVLIVSGSCQFMFGPMGEMNPMMIEPQIMPDEPINSDLMLTGDISGSVLPLTSAQTTYGSSVLNPSPATGATSGPIASTPNTTASPLVVQTDDGGPAGTGSGVNAPNGSSAGVTGLSGSGGLGEAQQSGQNVDPQITARAAEPATGSAPSATSAQGLPVQNTTLSKSELFAFPGVNPTTVGALKASSSRLTRFHIWWLVGQDITTVPERQRPDYIFLWPRPFQQGIPAVNMSQALLTPLPRPEVLRALVEEAPGMLPSQLAVIVQRVRLNDPSTLRSIINSQNPSVLLSKFNPRLVKANIRTIIRTIMEMPETGRFGITSVHAKLLPVNMLTEWLQSVNLQQWTARDLLGQTPVGASNELQLALPGLTCNEIRKLVNPVDVIIVADAYRVELYTLRTMQDVAFPNKLRRCFLDGVMHYLSTKPATGHVLDTLTAQEIRAIGGEILMGIPSAALKLANSNTQLSIIHEISKLAPITLATFSTLSKLQTYADIIFSSTNTIQDTTGPDPFLQGFQGQGIVAADFSDSMTASTQLAQPIADSGSQNENTTTIPDLSASLAGAAPTGTRARRQTAASTNSNADRMGGLFCYSSLFPQGNIDRNTLRSFLEQKDSIGQKTCCMDTVARGVWSRFLKTVFGSDIRRWTETDLLTIGDLMVALTPDEIATIPLEALSKVATRLIKQTGYRIQLQAPASMDVVSFATICSQKMGRSEGLEFLAAEKAYMKRLAQAAQWMFTSADARTSQGSGDLNITCDGLNVAGHAANGYSAEDLMKMDSTEFFDCIETIGMLDFDDATKTKLLNHIKTEFQLTSDKLSIYVLLELGNLVPALTPQDAIAMPLNLPRSADSLAVLGLKVKNSDTLSAIADRVIADNSASPGVLGVTRSPELRVSIRSLGNVLCKLNQAILTNVFESDPTLLLDTSPDLGRLEGCTFNTLSVLANNAIKTTNYGPPATWSLEDVRTLGIIVAGLQPNAIAMIPPASMEGLTPLAMRVMPTQSLLSLSADQLRSLPPDAAAALDANQINLLSAEQTEALKYASAILTDNFVIGVPLANSSNPNSFTGFGSVGQQTVQPTSQATPDLQSRAAPENPAPVTLTGTNTTANVTTPAPALGDDEAVELGFAGRSIPEGSNSTILNGTEVMNGTEHAVVDPALNLNITDIHPSNATEGTVTVGPEDKNATHSNITEKAHPAGDTGLLPADPTSSGGYRLSKSFTVQCFVLTVISIYFL